MILSRRGLEALYNKAEMPEALYGVARGAIEVLDEMGRDEHAHDLERFRSRVITRVLAVVDTAEATDTDYLLDKLWEVLICKSVDAD